MDGCYFCGCVFSSVRELPGSVVVRACDVCHDDIVDEAMNLANTACTLSRDDRSHA